MSNVIVANRLLAAEATNYNQAISLVDQVVMDNCLWGHDDCCKANLQPTQQSK